jgi:uncharacterized protein (TIGR03437 family)
MRNTFLTIFLTLLAGGSVFAQPKIALIVNNASYATPPSDSNGPIGNSVIAQGSIFAVFGTGLGPATIAYPPGLPLPTAVPAANGTSISISSGGTKVAAYIVYTVASQVGAILPSTTPVGNANVTVTYNGRTSASYTISVVPSRLGIFTSNQKNSGPAAAQHGADSTPVLLTKAVQPGETIVLYGTGLGPISGPDNVAPGQVSVGSNVTVNIAGTIIKPTYAGRSPSFAGLDQVNVQIPAGVATGCYTPAEVTVGGQASNAFYLPIANGSVCTHPYGLGADALARLDANGTVNTGVFLMLTAVLDNVPAQGAGGVFFNANADVAFELFTTILVAFGGYDYPVKAGSCAYLDLIDPAAGFSVPNLGGLGGKELSAGIAVDLNGSNGNSAVILRATDPNSGKETGGYLTTFFNTLGKGTWKLSGTGGPDVGTFSGATNLPDGLVWSNAGNLGNPPRGDLTITWTGGNLNGQSVVTIFGSEVVVNPKDPTKTRGGQFYCNATASAGTFMIPGAVVSKLPSSSVDSGAGEVAFGQLGIYTGNGSTFSVPLVSGAKFDGAYLSYGEAQTIAAKFQ